MNIDEAIDSFLTWNKPWLFLDAVRSLLEGKDIELFNAAWAAVIDEGNWQQSDLALCGQIANARVREEFPMLSEKAIKAIVRAASYEWK